MAFKCPFLFAMLAVQHAPSTAVAQSAAGNIMLGSQHINQHYANGNVNSIRNRHDGSVHGMPQSNDDHNIMPATHQLPSSPQCWLEAVDAINAVPAQGDASQMCLSMTVDQQKQLALALASCHLTDVGRPLYDGNRATGTDQALEMCAQQVPTTPEDTSTCLKLLSEPGLQAYTHFFSYVNQLCTRLLQEVAVLHFESTSHLLAQASSQVRNNLDDLKLEQQRMQLAHREQYHHMMDLHSVFSQHVQNQTGSLATQVHLIQSEITDKTTKWKQMHSELREQQEQSLAAQKAELEGIMSALHQARNTVDPWFSLFDAVQHFGRSKIALLKALVAMLGWLAVIIIATAPLSHRATRQRLIILGVIHTVFNRILETHTAMQVGGIPVLQLFANLMASLVAILYLHGIYRSVFSNAPQRNGFDGATDTDVSALMQQLHSMDARLTSLTNTWTDKMGTTELRHHETDGSGFMGNKLDRTAYQAQVSRPCGMDCIPASNGTAAMVDSQQMERPIVSLHGAIQPRFRHAFDASNPLEYSNDGTGGSMWPVRQPGFSQPHLYGRYHPFSSPSAPTASAEPPRQGMRQPPFTSPYFCPQVNAASRDHESDFESVHAVRSGRFGYPIQKEPMIQPTHHEPASSHDSGSNTLEETEDAMSDDERAPTVHRAPGGSVPDTIDGPPVESIELSHSVVRDHSVANNPHPHDTEAHGGCSRRKRKNQHEEYPSSCKQAKTNSSQ